MSPARSRRTPIPHRRSRSDILTAVGVGAGIVVVTALLIWLLRPGEAGTVATGGVMNRQPRASALIAVTIVVGAIAGWYLLRRSRRARRNLKKVVPIAIVMLLIVASMAGFFWPGGVLRHDVTQHLTPLTTPTVPPTQPSTTGATGASSTTGGTPTSKAPTTGTPTPPSP